MFYQSSEVVTSGQLTEGRVSNRDVNCLAQEHRRKLPYSHGSGALPVCGNSVKCDPLSISLVARFQSRHVRTRNWREPGCNGRSSCSRRRRPADVHWRCAEPYSDDCRHSSPEHARRTPKVRTSTGSCRPRGTAHDARGCPAGADGAWTAGTSASHHRRVCHGSAQASDIEAATEANS